MKNFKPGTKITGDSMMGDTSDRVEVTGTYVRRFGKGNALLIETDNRTRHVIDGDTARHAEPTAAMLLHQLAEHMDAFEDVGSVGDVDPGRGKLRVQLYEAVAESAIGAMLPWLESVGATAVSARHVKDTWHIHGAGQAMGGSVIELVAIADGAEAAALDEAFSDCGGDGKRVEGIPVEALAQCRRPVHTGGAV